MMVLLKWNWLLSTWCLDNIATFHNLKIDWKMLACNDDRNQNWSAVVVMVFVSLLFWTKYFETKMFGWCHVRLIHLITNLDCGLFSVPSLPAQRNTVFCRMICIELRFFAWNNIFFPTKRNKVEDTQNWDRKSKSNERKPKKFRNFKRYICHGNGIYWVLSEWINWKCNIRNVRSARLCSNVSFFSFFLLNFIYVCRRSFWCVYEDEITVQCIWELWLEICTAEFIPSLLSFVGTWNLGKKRLKAYRFKSFDFHCHHATLPVHCANECKQNRTNNLISLFDIFFLSFLFERWSGDSFVLTCVFTLKISISFA